MRSKWFLVLFMAALLVLSSACGGSGGDGEGTERAGKERQDGAAPDTPGLEDVPDVVAEVNGEEVGKDAFVTMYEAQYRQMAAQAESAGSEVGEEQQEQLRSQVAESLVTTELLLQEAESRDITASDAEVEKTLADIAQQNGMPGVDALLTALEEQGMDRDEVTSQVRTQIRIAGLVEDEAGDIEPTDREVRARYQELVAQQKAAADQAEAQQSGGEKGVEKGEQAENGVAQREVPPLKEIRPQLVDQIKKAEHSRVAKALLERLREDGNVEIFV